MAPHRSGGSCRPGHRVADCLASREPHPRNTFVFAEHGQVQNHLDLGRRAAQIRYK